jgi:hypothetical protein
MMALARATSGTGRSGWRSLPFVLLILVSSGCGFYSFTGAAIPAHLNTVSIPLVDLRAPGAPPELDQTLTDLLIDRFVRQTRLALEPEEGAADAVLTARVDRYANEPVAVTGQEVAALNRVTISLNVRYYDRREDRDRLQRTFQASAEYDPLAAGFEGEGIAAQQALRRLADDVFNAATSDW